MLGRKESDRDWCTGDKVWGVLKDHPDQTIDFFFFELGLGSRTSLLMDDPYSFRSTSRSGYG